MHNQVQLEDALKFLYKEERAGRSLTAESLAGGLALTLAHATDVIASLSSSGVLEWHEESYRVTPAGAEDALRIIRAHRLYETYLADQTGISDKKWHRIADQKEHQIDSEELRRIEAALGFPKFDPHGDPIPKEGVPLPPPQGSPLLALSTGDVCRVLHVEDEPEQVYARISKAGIASGTLLKLGEHHSEGLELYMEGGKVLIDRAMAANFRVGPLPDSPGPDPDLEPLSNLLKGQTATVHGLTPACRGPERNRLLDLGVVPGAIIRHEYAGFSGNPVAYRIRGALVALRGEQARRILVRHSSVGSPQEGKS